MRKDQDLSVALIIAIHIAQRASNMRHLQLRASHCKTSFKTNDLSINSHYITSTDKSQNLYGTERGLSLVLAYKTNRALTPLGQAQRLFPLQYAFVYLEQPFRHVCLFRKDFCVDNLGADCEEPFVQPEFPALTLVRRSGQTAPLDRLLYREDVCTAPIWIFYEYTTWIL